MGLEVRGLAAGYGAIGVLSEISFEVPSGGILAIVGANGAGKTTLLSAISGALKSSSGQVLLDDSDLTSLTAERRAVAGIAHCPEGRGIFGSLTVEENLLVGTFPRRRMDRGRRPELLAQAYDRFPILAERRNSMGGQLSGGQQQMLAFARALMSSPALLLLDEPSLGLAPSVTEEIYQAISCMPDSGITTVVVEEGAARALGVATHVVVLRKGKVALDSPRGDLGEDELVRAYFGSSEAA